MGVRRSDIKRWKGGRSRLGRRHGLVIIRRGYTGEDGQEPFLQWRQVMHQQCDDEQQQDQAANDGHQQTGPPRFRLHQRTYSLDIKFTFIFTEEKLK